MRSGIGRDGAGLATADDLAVVNGPPLRLRMPRMNAPARPELEPGHPLYPQAAFAFHHAHRLPHEVRRALFLALDAAWPVSRGRRKEDAYRVDGAQRMAASGATAEQVADAFDVRPDTARRWMNRVDDDSGQRVEAAWADQGEVPEDPASDLVYARWLCRPTDELAAQRDAAERVRRAPTGSG